MVSIAETTEVQIGKYSQPYVTSSVDSELDDCSYCIFNLYTLRTSIVLIVYSSLRSCVACSAETESMFFCHEKSARIGFYFTTMHCSSSKTHFPPHCS